MGTVEYIILSGAPPFTAELNPSDISANIHTTTGTYYFSDVPDGEYTLIITDSNGCTYEKYILVDPTAPVTTTTTLPPDDSIIIGSTIEPTLIFNKNATNRTTHYTHFNGDIATIYLWFKTTNGRPLTTNKIFNYNFELIVPTTTTTSTTTTTTTYPSGELQLSSFEFINVSDEIHVLVEENVAGPSSEITGQIVLQAGFIESFFKYTFTQVSTYQTFKVNLSSSSDWLNTTIPLVDATKIYGVEYIDKDNIIMGF